MGKTGKARLLLVATVVEIKSLASNLGSESNFTSASCSYDKTDFTEHTQGYKMCQTYIFVLLDFQGVGDYFLR